MKIILETMILVTLYIFIYKAHPKHKVSHIFKKSKEVVLKHMYIIHKKIMLCI